MLNAILKNKPAPTQNLYHWTSVVRLMLCQVPIKGLSDVIGIIDDTVLRKMVRDRRMVTPNK